MKLGICLVTRNNPGPLIGVVMSLWRLRSNQHELQFIIGIDNDDENTMRASPLTKEINPLPIFTIGERAPARGTTENRVLSIARAQDCDLATLLTDRTFPITPGWDDVLARGVTEQPKRPLWWSCPHDNVCAIPIMPKDYLDALDWKWSPELFPFWFDDTWNQQIDLLIHGLPSKKVKASFAGQRGKTTRGRDFGFWIDFFHRLLPMRVNIAESVANAQGIEFKIRPDVIQYFAGWYEQMMKGAETLEQTFGDPRDPGPEYEIAKSRAQKMLTVMVTMDFGVAAQ